MPSGGHGERLMRTGILAEHLQHVGDEVVWWTSDFDHTKKVHRLGRDGVRKVDEHYEIRFLHSIGYRHNVSLRRMIDHAGVAKKFRSCAPELPRPDVILCSLPTVELCNAALDFGIDHNIPVVLDVRDLWPDLFLDVAPNWARPAARALCTPLFRAAERACRRANGLIGTTKHYVDWALAKAGRRRGALDRDFPLAYREAPPPESELADARRFWAEKGLQENSGSFVACFFGVFGRHAEIPVVIDAASKLARQGCGVKFVLCGLGPNFEKCRELAGDCPNVIIPGWMNAAQIWTLLRISAVGLAPFVSNENYLANIPNKPIEYLSAGLPVVSSLQGALAELLEQNDCGRTYPNGDSKALAAMLADLYSRVDLRERLAFNARRLYASRFVAERVYADLAEYLRHVAQSRSNALLAA